MRRRPSIAPEKLHDTPFRQAVAPGELEIPAVRGLGGSLIYFVDPTSELKAVWDVEFDAVAGQGKADAGLRTIDHVSQSMRYEEMLSWLLFYSSLLDVTKTPQLDITDPGGIVVSQVIQNADDSLRIALNGSQSERTQVVKVSVGLFRIRRAAFAFGTDDIFAAAQAAESQWRRDPADPGELLRRSGGALRIFRPICSNACRRAISSTTRTRPANICRSIPRASRTCSFFEIVERRNYKGFGAPNAPIRLAAQSRQARHPAIPRH